MQIAGKPERVRLNCDLTRYNSKLLKGQIGYTMPNVKLSMWGSSDRFVAVKFDCGVSLDTLYKSLDFLDRNTSNTLKEEGSHKGN